MKLLHEHWKQKDNLNTEVIFHPFLPLTSNSCFIIRKVRTFYSWPIDDCANIICMEIVEDLFKIISSEFEWSWCRLFWHSPAKPSIVLSKLHNISETNSHKYFIGSLCGGKCDNINKKCKSRGFTNHNVMFYNLFIHSDDDI